MFSTRNDTDDNHRVYSTNRVYKIRCIFSSHLTRHMYRLYSPQIDLNWSTIESLGAFDIWLNNLGMERHTQFTLSTPSDMGFKIFITATSFQPLNHWVKIFQYKFQAPIISWWSKTIQSHWNICAVHFEQPNHTYTNQDIVYE